MINQQKTLRITVLTVEVCLSQDQIQCTQDIYALNVGRISMLQTKGSWESFGIGMIVAMVFSFITYSLGFYINA